jgi:hypothetical protein
MIHVQIEDQVTATQAGVTVSSTAHVTGAVGMRTDPPALVILDPTTRAPIRSS